MAVVRVEASRSYDVLIDECPLDAAGDVVRRASGGDAAFIVSDSNVAPLYLGRVRASLEQAGYTVGEFVFPAGESSKTLATYGECLDAFSRAGLTRASVVVALGGGVVGDLAGFAAATWMRGCRCIQIPTSLLACVDSSVGGKTAVDIPAGKNLVGAFFQPDAVLVDTSVLSTLPGHYFADGCAEVLKYGVIADAGLFASLEDAPLHPGDARLARVIARCVEIKRDIVQADEREGGVRQILNFGHTLGHAIEKASGYSITHGFAVACGMSMMARACAVRGWCSAGDAKRLARAVRACGLPDWADAPAETLYEAALADKKRVGAAINAVILRTLGKAEIASLDLGEFRRFVDDAVQVQDDEEAAWLRV